MRRIMVGMSGRRNDLGQADGGAIPPRVIGAEGGCGCPEARGRVTIARCARGFEEAADARR